MTTARLATTGQLSADKLVVIRSLCDAAFGDAFDGADWEHTLGGTHVLIEDDGTVLAHGAVVPRVLTHGDRALRTGYVEAVAVAPTHQRRGLGAMVMAQLAPVIARHYEIGALASSDDGLALYRATGWSEWRGPLWVAGPDGRTRTPDDDGSVFVRAGTVDLPALDLDADLTCDWRSGDVW